MKYKKEGLNQGADWVYILRSATSVHFAAEEKEGGETRKLLIGFLMK